MKLKRILTGIFIFSVLLTSALPSFAEEGIINNEKNQENIYTAQLDTNSSDIVLSEVLTFDEIVERIAKDNNIPKNEASEQLVNSFYESERMSSLGEVSPYAATYRTITATITVTSTYKPTLKFYCRTSESGGFRGILNILNVGMNRSYNGTSKQFGGHVYTKLEDANRIFYIVNGDFYNNGTTNYSGGVNIGVGKAATVNFAISHSTNHYKYIYKEAHRKF